MSVVDMVAGGGSSSSGPANPRMKPLAETAAVREALAESDRKVDPSCQRQLDSVPPPAANTGSEPGCRHEFVCLPGMDAPRPMLVCDGGDAPAAQAVTPVSGHVARGRPDRDDDWRWAGAAGPRAADSKGEEE
ncbi:hypothetical protein [Minwuia thermotolerans]|uniref:hypothetical protein n=1 Tax=Minwuia thermotolerans TaxID=2056226 RepID=UPI000F651C75|nr:hypothetical protein [Minwuia thermotolerans]